jgi:hypothetical protein
LGNSDRAIGHSELGERGNQTTITVWNMPLFTRKRTEEAESVVSQFEPLPKPPEPDRGQLRSMQAHRQYLLSCVTPLRAFRQHILDGVGLHICEDIVAGIDLPRFDNSAMDGYAVRAGRWSGRLRLEKPRCIGCLPVLR